MGAAFLFCMSWNTMKKIKKRIIYRGVWQGLGKIYNIKVESGYTTIIVKPGEDVQKRSKETMQKFVSQALSQ
jgi:hypothetical protein